MNLPIDSCQLQHIPRSLKQNFRAFQVVLTLNIGQRMVSINEGAGTLTVKGFWAMGFGLLHDGGRRTE